MGGKGWGLELGLIVVLLLWNVLQDKFPRTQCHEHLHL